MKLDGYVRVSRVGKRSGPSFISPELQREKIEQWASLRDVEIAQWHTDLDESGGKLSRPGLDAMMARVESGATDGVAVARIDRLSRAGVADALKLVERLLERDPPAQLAVVDLGVDPTTMWGEFAMTLMLALARMQRRQLTESWSDSQSRAIARGEHFMEPFGYTRGEDRRLHPDGDAGAVRQVFEMRAGGRSWQDIANWLNGRGPSPAGGQWTGRTVKHVVANPVYLGEAYHGQHRKADAHEPLVSRAQWDAAQGEKGQVPAGEGLLLTGIIRCAGCRYRLKGDHYGPANGRVAIYRCRGRHGAGRCLEPATITAHLADEWVLDRFRRRYSNQGVRGTDSTPQTAAAVREHRAAELELDGFLSDLRLRSALGPDRYARQAEALTREVDRTKRALRDAQGHVSVADGVELQEFDDLTVDQRRRLLGAGVGAVFLRRTGNAPLDQRLRLFWPSEVPDDLPGPGNRSVGVRPLDWDEVEAG